MMRSPVGIADLLRVSRALRTQGRALEAVARMFSLTVSPPPTLPPGPAVPPDIEVEDHAEVSADPASVYAADDGDSTHIRWLKPAAQEEPAAVPTTLSDPLPPRRPSQIQPRREYLALLDPHVAAELMLTAASTNTPTAEIDVDTVVDILCRQRPLTELPHLHSLSVDTGVRVLVDVGESMQPFLRDQTEFLAELRRLVGAPIHVGFFADDPRTGTGPTRRRASWRRYEVPETGQPVIVLSDLGFGVPRREAAIRAWRILCSRLRQRGSLVVVFAPLELRRVPERLRRSLELVVWDRSTKRSRAADLRLRLT
jgi:hypothetical protein